MCSESLFYFKNKPAFNKKMFRFQVIPNLKMLHWTPNNMAMVFKDGTSY
jgi:hypothetical protein